MKINNYYKLLFNLLYVFDQLNSSVAVYHTSCAIIDIFFLVWDISRGSTIFCYYFFPYAFLESKIIWPIRLPKYHDECDLVNVIDCLRNKLIRFNRGIIGKYVVFHFHTEVNRCTFNLQFMILFSHQEARFKIIYSFYLYKKKRAGKKLSFCNLFLFYLIGTDNRFTCHLRSSESLTNLASKFCLI